MIGGLEYVSHMAYVARPRRPADDDPDGCSPVAEEAPQGHNWPDVQPPVDPALLDDLERRYPPFLG